MHATLGHYAGSIIFFCGFPLAGLAFLKGGTPERLGALAILLAWTLSGWAEMARTAATLAWTISIPVLAIEFGLSMAFLGLALRYGSVWLGAAMVAQGTQLGLHAFYISGEGHGWRLFALASNLISGLQLLLLLAAIVSSWRRRTRAKAPIPAYV